MVVVREEPGVLYVGMRDIVEREDIRKLRNEGQRYLTSSCVDAIVVDIRGCKPVDRQSCAMLRSLLVAAKAGGVGRFYRIGDGTLFALQMLAVEQEAELHGVMVLSDEDKLPFD
jgi:hypothetical protein